MNRSIVRTLTAAAGLALGVPMVLLAGGCAGSAERAADTTSPARPMIAPWGFDLTGMDRTASAGEDFYAYTSGTWDKNTQIRPDRPLENAFAALDDLSTERCRTILESLSPSDEGERGMLASLYASYMNEANAERLDAQPVRPLLDEIRSLSDHNAFCAWMGRATAGFGVAPFTASVEDDDRDPEHYSLFLHQGGLGLGNREFYLRDNFKPRREKYRDYVQQLLGMVGWSDPSGSADAVVALETSIAQAHWTLAQSRNVDKTYNPMSVAELESAAPGFGWRAFLDNAGYTQVQRTIVVQNTAFPAIAEIIGKADIGTLRAWAAAHVLDKASPLLSSRFVQANFDFRSKYLNSVPEMRPRWKRGVEFVERSMGEALGREYVARYFPPAAKAQAEELVRNVRTALRARLENLPWMTAPTKARAMDKFERFGLKIGYPSKWRSFTGLRVAGDDLFGNALRARRFNTDYFAARVGQRVDPDEFGMTPQTVNAYYTTTRNEIVFPAAILQPPFFDPSADAAINYGGIGAVIGHEMTHGFDDQGRKSNGRGYLEDWWSEADEQQFEQRTKVLGDSFAAVTFPQYPDLRINPEQTMGENIADLGGILLAIDAYALSLGGKPAPVLDGFTGEQRVFLGWAQVWRTKVRDEAFKQRIISDVHSPGSVRAYLPLRHVDAWYGAFNVQPGQAGYIAPEQRARIW